MIKLADITFYSNKTYASPSQLIRAQLTSLAYIDHVKESVSVSVIKHSNFKTTIQHNSTPFYFLKGNNSFFHLPLTSCFLLRKIKPEVILVQGLIFPVQIILLRLVTGRSPKIIVQHHGEHPFGLWKRWFQKLAGKCVNAYLFTAKENADGWIAAGIIRDQSLCYEVLEASTFFERKDKRESRQKCGISGSFNFLWVGRLNTNKDPMTILKAFERFVTIRPSARLYMIFQAEELLDKVAAKIQSERLLQDKVILVGKVDHNELPYWFSAADYYLSGSRSEGSGYALIEAMSCGCIPIVTDIPSFRKITANGQYGYLYKPGNTDQLSGILSSLTESGTEEQSNAVTIYFKQNLTFQSIASNISGLCESLLRE